MSKRKSVKSKIKEGYGTGKGANYTSFLETREFNPISTTCNTTDWKTGRIVELMSQVEMHIWFILRWQDNIKDIREQMPLRVEDTIKIANQFNIKHPRFKGEPIPLTTDFLVTLDDGNEIAIYVKSGRDDWKATHRETEKTFLQKYYWKEIEKVDFRLISKEDINVIFAKNIAMVTEFYDKARVFDDMSLLKHKIATKQIIVDMKSKFLDYPKLLEEYGGKLNE